MLNVALNNTKNINNVSFGSSNRSEKFKLYDATTGGYIEVERPKQSAKDKFESRVKEEEKRQRLERRRQREIQRKKAFRRKVAAGLAVLSTFGTMICYSLNDTNKTKTLVETPVIVSEAPVAEAKEDEIDIFDDVNKLLESNLELKSAYDKITTSIDTFSNQLGEDGLSLIKERVNALGDGEINVIDVLKVLWIESNGNIYDDNGNYLESYTGEAYGPFQLTPDTVDYINNYFGLEEPLDIMNPYDNLDACILNLRFLKDKKEADSENSILPTGENIMDAVFWCYHDGAWADDITEQGDDYLAKYRDLSIVDSYPEVVEYITNGLC